MYCVAARRECAYLDELRDNKREATDLQSPSRTEGERREGEALEEVVDEVDRSLHCGPEHCDLLKLAIRHMVDAETWVKLEKG